MPACDTEAERQTELQQQRHMTVLHSFNNDNPGKLVRNVFHSGFYCRMKVHGDDNWTYKNMQLHSNRHHQQATTCFFTGWMHFPSPNQDCQCTEGK